VLVGSVSVFGFAFAALLLFYAASPYIDKGVIPFSHSALGDALVFGSAAACCLIICTQLIAGRRWAWWTTVGFCALTLFAGLFFFWAATHPRDDFARSEGGFGFFLSILLTAPSAFCLGVLNLPLVRKKFFSQTAE
jgi:hypothetical protein